MRCNCEPTLLRCANGTPKGSMWSEYVGGNIRYFVLAKSLSAQPKTTSGHCQSWTQIPRCCCEHARGHADASTCSSAAQYASHRQERSYRVHHDEASKMLHARENPMPAALPCSHRLARMNMVYLPDPLPGHRYQSINLSSIELRSRLSLRVHMQFYKHWGFFFWGCNILHWRICFPATTLCRDHSRAPLTDFLPGRERNGEALILHTWPG